MKLILTCTLILWSSVVSAQDHQNPVVQSIVDWHRQYCYDNLADLRNESRVPLESDFGIDEGSIYDIEIAENQTATVVYKSFTCEGMGHGWCGSGGCGYFIVVGDKVFLRQGGYKPQLATISTANGNRSIVVFGIHGGGCDDADGRGGAGFDPCYGVAVWDEHSQTFFSRDGDIQTWSPD